MTMKKTSTIGIALAMLAMCGLGQPMSSKVTIAVNHPKNIKASKFLPSKDGQVAFCIDVLDAVNTMPLPLSERLAKQADVGEALILAVDTSIAPEAIACIFCCSSTTALSNICSSVELKHHVMLNLSSQTKTIVEAIDKKLAESIDREVKLAIVDKLFNVTNCQEEIESLFIMPVQYGMTGINQMDIANSNTSMPIEVDMAYGLDRKPRTMDKTKKYCPRWIRGSNAPLVDEPSGYHCQTVN